MSWHQYRKIKQGDSEKNNFYISSPEALPKVTKLARKKNRLAVTGKIRQLREYDPLQKTLSYRAARAGCMVMDVLQSDKGSKRAQKLHSSVSLPSFTAARLRHAVGWHKKNFNYHWLHSCRRRASESEILLACLVLLVGKLKRREGALRQLVGPRFRMYNEDRYSYEKVTVYVERSLWLALQARALELEVSLSYLVDLAIRLYLNFVLRKLAEWRAPLRQLVRRMDYVPQGSGWAKLPTRVGVDYLRNLLKVVSYQKKTLWAKYSHPPWGRPGQFSLQLDYFFGQKTP